MSDKPLITPDDISCRMRTAAKEINGYVSVETRDAYEVALGVQREYEAELTRLRAQLAEAQQWEDVPDGDYEVRNNRFLKLLVRGSGIQIADSADGYCYAIFSRPDKWRIQRRKEADNG